MFQRRINDHEYFNRTWADYKTGFGNLSSNFWLGNENIHRLTATKRELILDVHFEAGDHSFILYKSFQVANEDAFYKLHVSDYQPSTGDCFEIHNGEKFSTIDRDHDKHKTKHCARKHESGWWFGDCTVCFLNGALDPSAESFQRARIGVWEKKKFLSWSEMKLREREGDL